MLTAFLISLVFSLVCNYFDIRQTMKGLRAGVAVEDNGIANWVFRLMHKELGEKNLSALDLWMANAIPKTVICFLAYLIFKYQASTTGIGLIGGPTLALLWIGVDHLRGARAWSALLKKAGK